MIEGITTIKDQNTVSADLFRYRALLKISRAGPVSTFHQAERNAIIDALKAASGQISGRTGAAERLGLKTHDPAEQDETSRDYHKD